MQGHNRAKTKKLLKQLFVGNNPKTALTSLMDFTGVQETQGHPSAAERPQSASVDTETTATLTPPCEECTGKDQNRGSYAILAALLGGIGIAAIAVGVAIACTGVGGPVGGGASIAGATLLVVAGAVACGAGLTSGGVGCGEAMKQTKKRTATTEDATVAIEEYEGTEQMGTTQSLDRPHHGDPLIRSRDRQQQGDEASFCTINGAGTSATCTSYNPLNWPVSQAA